MAYRATLSKIEFDIKKGRKEKAITRLRSLINNNPHDLEIRNRLAELYFSAGFHDAAGKFWILNDSDEKHIIKCVELYETSVNRSGNQILKEIKFTGDKTKLPLFAQRKLEHYEKDSLAKTNSIPTFQKVIKAKSDTKKKLSIFESVKADLLKVGCYATFALICTSIIIGIITIYNYFF